MTGEHLEAQARRVVTGVDTEGRSCIVSDGLTPHRLAGPGLTKCDIWRAESLPTPLTADDGIDEMVSLPQKAGLVYRVVSFPPDSEWDRTKGYSDAKGALPGSDIAEKTGIPGLHVTETVDILTILSGELYVVTETGEALLRPGDTLVQRGTTHAWSNRGTVPATAVSLMMAAEP
jgi:mannose-6-phosphate isomerase-like protein (cupin superfamily)